ncbi:DMT family transporter [Novimethylophilus kurashikiensis]|nr:DMT family transporter [Novimethylophilus kurashikiensis]
MRTTVRGSLWMLVAGIFFAVMGVCVKLGAARYSTAQLVFYRSLFGFLTILVITRAQNLPLATPRWQMHFSRSIVGFISMMMFFYAITKLPLATAITLNYTSPLFLAMITAMLMRVAINRILIAAMILGFIGVITLLNPTMQEDQWRASLIGLLSGAMAGWAYYQVTQLGRIGEPEWRTVFYFTLVSTLGSGAWMSLETFHPLHAADLILLVSMGTSATLAQLAMTRAYRKGQPLVAGSLAYSTVVFASLFGIVLWGEVLSFDQWVAIALITSSGVLSVWATKRGKTHPT